MIYLLLAIISSTLISLGMRASDGHINNNLSMLAVNYGTCIVLAILYTGLGPLLPQSEGIEIALGIGVLTGLLYLASFLLFQWNVSINGIVLPATFMKLGVLVPTIMSVLFFKETPGVGQIIGFLGALIAIVLVQLEGGKTKVAKRWALPLLLLVGGAGDAVSKIYDEIGPVALKDQYLFYTFFVALIICIGLIFWKKQRLGKNELLFGLLIGIPNYFSARFLLLSLDTVPAMVAFPTFSVGAILTTTCVGILLFKEKLSRQRILALGIILISLVLLNL